MNTLDRQCEKFLGGPTIPYSERAHATIRFDGRILINQKVHAMMGRPQAVYLYFNRQKDTIILEPTLATTSSEAFTLKDGQHGSRIVYANPFCKHFGIKAQGTQRFLDPQTDAAGRLYLKLNETVTVTRGPKKSQNRLR
jgi:hypothetical protein